MKQALWRDLRPNEARVGGVSTNLAKNRLLESKCEACVLKHGFCFCALFVASWGLLGLPVASFARLLAAMWGLLGPSWGWFGGVSVNS